MHILIKVIIVSLLIFMVYNLVKALFVMVKNDPKQGSPAKFIGRRVIASAAIVMLILLAILTGVITPNPRPF